jgi:hypothetical protein
MTPGFSVLAAVRKKLRSVGECATAQVVDGLVRHAGVPELESNERAEVAVRFLAPAADNRPAIGGLFHLAGDVFVDLERIDTDVRSDGHDELGGVVRKGFDGAEHDAGNGATPTRVRGADVPARWVRDQHRHAVARARSNSVTVDAGDQPIALFIGDGLREL